MSRLLPHLSRDLENALVEAVAKSNDGYPHALEALRNGPLTGDLITEEDIDAVSNELEMGAQESRQAFAEDREYLEEVGLGSFSELDREDAAERDNYPFAGDVADRETQYSRYIDCGPGAWDDRDDGGCDG